MMNRMMVLLAALLLVPGAVFAADDKDPQKEKEENTFVDTWPEFADKHVSRVEDAANKGIDELGEIIKRESEESHSGCNNASLGTRTREALGCD